MTDFQPTGDCLASVDIVCPMPAPPEAVCGKDLHLVWTSSRGLYLLDVTFPEPIDEGDAWVRSWRVECEDGHVLLLPGDPGCKCADEVAAEPGHDCDVDASEESRSFRRSDGARLGKVLAHLNRQ